MERLVIEKLEGAHRNSVEGATNAPLVVKNINFDRGGGYAPLGGIEGGWLGAREISGIVMEDGDDLLYEDGGDVGSEWQPAANFGNANLLAYDEATLALLNGPRLWFDNELLTFTGTSFNNEADLGLAPRAGILAPWRYVNGSYIGAARYVGTNGLLSYGAGAGTVTVTTTAGTGTLAGNYEFIWVLEAPTDNGLVVFAVETHPHTLGAEVESISLELNTIYPAGTMARFYYRTTTDDAFERVSALVSNGTAKMKATLIREGTFDATDDALITFAGGRLEVHGGRMWGRAATRPLVPFLPSAQLQRQDGGHMLLSGGLLTTARQHGAILSANMALRAVGDYVEMDIQRLFVQRPTTDRPVLVELFNVRKTAAPDINLDCYLYWPGTKTEPEVILFVSDNADGSYMADPRVSLNALHLGRAAGSVIDLQAVEIKIAISAIAGSVITTACDISVGQASQSLTSTRTVDAAVWTAYSAAAATTLAIGRLSDRIQAFIDRLIGATIGNRELQITRIESGSGATVKALGRIEDYAPTALTWTSSGPQAETWTTVTHDSMIVNYELVQLDLPDENPVTNPNLTLVYSSTGSVNRGKNTNFLPFSPLTSTRITALASTPAGLLVFMENETFLVRGDPALELSTQRLSGTLGCDPGVIPARLGSVVMPIYKGEVYAVNLGGGDVDFGGSMVNISRPIWLPDDPFVQVVGEAKRQHVVARTAQGRVYRMDVSEQKWMNDPFDEVPNVWEMIPADADGMYGTRYNVGGYLEVVSDAIINTPAVEWANLDAGDKNAMKLWRRVELFTEGVGDGVPVLTYTARGVSETVGGIEKGQGRWVFTFKRGVVSPTLGMKFEFLGATGDFVMEPPLVVEYVPRYRQR